MLTSIDKFKKIFFIFPALLTLVLLINTRFTLWPEMMVYPYLLNNDFLLYKDLINPYPPAYIFFLSQFSGVFNYSITSYQLLTWSTVVLVNATIYFLVLKIFENHYFAVSSALFFAIIAIPFGVNGLWFDLIQTPLTLLSVYFFYRFLKFRKHGDLDYSLVFVLGAFFIKQQSVWLIIFYGAVVLTIYKLRSFALLLKLRKFLVFLTLALVCQFLIFWKLATLPDFLFWVLYFPFFKASSIPGYFSPPTIRQALTIAGLILFISPVLFSTKREHKIILFCSIALLFFAYPRFDYFHIIPALSVLSLLVGENIQLFSKSANLIKASVIFAALVLVVFSTRFYQNNWTNEIRFFEPDILAAASFLSLSTNPSDRIYIQNGPDQLLPLAHRLPPKPWADEFPWYLEKSNLQNRVVKALNETKPKFAVYKPYLEGNILGLGVYQPKQISSFIEENYTEQLKISDTLWLKKKKNSFN